MKDTLTNHYLSVKNFFMKLFGITPFLYYEVSYYEKYDFQHEDSLDSFQYKPDWGYYHPKNLIQWYDSNAAKLTSNGLELLITNNWHTDKNIMIGVGIGYVMSKKSYGYGLFEWNVVLPKGKQLWPAIWLTDSITWPPEIDVLEAYSDDKMNYGRRLNSNVFFGKTPSHSQLGAMKHGNLIDKDEVLNLKLVWVENSIKIYYNNYLVRKITDKDIIKHFRGRQMKVIMNNAIRKESSFSDMILRPFIIQDFTYYQF